ncbi:class I SAM-dependent methyltransferase [Oscillatoria sp. CS-180]|uniref:class I SAM-dependent methyltransferase n=1 Tax=Oscillatoria sp. CS-180 TaxID=3021720 RepID=UPI0023301413|nr:class I SAM-dependent methyltransferase [Oscillatoria sp. CS-180]MDB9529327.1 class I SAM-dependent methyltransferase [Oscillatoria sp. CS-180]
MSSDKVVKTNYYNSIATIYDQTRWMSESVAEDIADAILTLVDANPNTSFLEPGVGTGLNILPFVKRGYSVTGIDISQAMLDQFRRKVQQTPSNLTPSNLTLIQADASELPFSESSFDVVLTVHMIHTVSHWPTFLGEIERVLKPEGFYLNAQWVVPPARKVFESQFKAILLQYKETQVPKRVDNWIEEIDGYFRGRGYQAEYQMVKEWSVTNTVAELLSYYQSRAYGFCWWVPDDIFYRVMADFEAFCADYYGSLETELSSTAQFELWIYTSSQAA